MIDMTFATAVFTATVLAMCLSMWLLDWRKDRT